MNARKQSHLSTCSRCAYSLCIILRDFRISCFRHNILLLSALVKSNVYSSESVRADEWDGVVTCHAGHGSIQTWNLNKYTIGQHTLSSKYAHLGAKPKVRHN